MAGSLKWFKYTTDSGDVFGIYMDESNGELVGNADMAALDDDTVVYALPRNVKPRTALYRSSDGLVSRRIVVTDSAADITTITSSFVVPAQDGNPAATMQLQSFRGEEIRRISSVDTGLTDGDAT
jgi:hypothetical protein